MDIKKIALFAAGTLFGSAGFKLLSSKDAKKVYTQTTAAVLRMKDSTMETVSKVQEQAGDILADAKAINEARAVEAEAAVIEDAAEETTEETAEEFSVRKALKAPTGRSSRLRAALFCESGAAGVQGIAA